MQQFEHLRICAHALDTNPEVSQDQTQKTCTLLVELLSSGLNVPHVELLEGLQLERLGACVKLARVHQTQIVEFAEPEVEELPVARVRDVDCRTHLLHVLEVLLPPRLRHLLQRV